MEVYLVDTSGEEDVCINDALVEGGLADARADSALAVSDPPRPAPASLAPLQSLLGIVGSMCEARGGDRDSDSASSVSASASQVAGGAGRRMRVWDADADAERPPPAAHWARMLARQRAARALTALATSDTSDTSECSPSDVSCRSELLRRRVRLHRRAAALADA